MTAKKKKALSVKTDEQIIYIPADCEEDPNPLVFWFGGDIVDAFEIRNPDISEDTEFLVFEYVGTARINLRAELDVQLKEKK